MSSQPPAQTSLPSRTSLMVAAGRAFGAREPDPTVRNPDLLAEKLFGPEELALIQEHPIGAALANPDAAPAFEAITTAAMMLIRTKFIDEKIRQSIENGATQFVILGAGFDTRAYRLEGLLQKGELLQHAELLQNLKVFEVDSAATQTHKRRRAEIALGPPPASLTYVTIDFNRDKLNGALLSSGFNPSEKTVFIWEGVSMYVAEAGVRETLRAIAQAAPGSTLVMDYTTQSMLEFMTQFPEIGPTKLLAKWGEPWVFGLPDGQEREFFAEAGLEAREIFPMFSPDTFKKYLTRADGTVLGAPPPGAQRPQISPEAQSAMAALAKRGGSFYTLAELAVPAAR
jgi:methyltransferase (TIGR00027 family)